MQDTFTVLILIATPTLGDKHDATDPVNSLVNNIVEQLFPRGTHDLF